MALFLCIILCNAFLKHVYSDTGSYQFAQNNAAELKYMQKAIWIMKREINFQATSRINMDKELSELTRRYRELMIENNDIKRELKETKINTGNNASSVATKGEGIVSIKQF